MKRKKYIYKLYIVILATVATVFSGCDKFTDNCSDKDSYEIVQPIEKGPFSIIQKISKAKINFSELINMQLIAVSVEGYEVDVNGLEGQLKDLSIVKKEKKNAKLDPNNNIVRTYNYVLDPFSDGVVTVPEIIFKFIKSEKNEQVHEIVTKPIDIEVVTTVAIDPNNTKQIADIIDVVEMRSHALVWILLGVTVLLSLVLLTIFICKKKNKQIEIMKIYKPAHEIAIEKLAELERENLILRGLFKQFYEKISGILRHYIEDRFDINAPERTTEEFLEELKFSPALGNEDKGLVGEFLQQCDLVKFAKYQPQQKDIKFTIEIVKDFVMKTKSDEKQIDVTDNNIKSNAAKVREE